MSLSLRAPLHSNEMAVDLFAGGGGASQSLIGNSVCPGMAEAVAAAQFAPVVLREAEAAAA